MSFANKVKNFFSPHGDKEWWRSPQTVLGILLRISFGLSLILVGIEHFKPETKFIEVVTVDLGSFTGFGVLWAYIYPALLIIGGVFLVIGTHLHLAVWSAGLGLAVIPVGMLFKSAFGTFTLDQSMSSAIAAFIWLIVFFFVLKLSHFNSKGECCKD